MSKIEIELTACLDDGADCSSQEVSCGSFEEAVALCRKWVRKEHCGKYGIGVRPRASVEIEQIQGNRSFVTFFDVASDGAQKVTMEDD